jgi:hypothetical protein
MQPPDWPCQKSGLPAGIQCRFCRSSEEIARECEKESSMSRKLRMSFAIVVIALAACIGVGAAQAHGFGGGGFHGGGFGGGGFHGGFGGGGFRGGGLAAAASTVDLAAVFMAGTVGIVASIPVTMDTAITRTATIVTDQYRR